jgi:hypothetical protein
VPDLSLCLIAFSERHQSPGEVLEIGDRVRDIGVAEDLSGFAFERPREHAVAHLRLMSMRPEEVGASADRGLNDARLMGVHEPLRDPRSRATVRPGRAVREVLGKGTVHRTGGDRLSPNTKRALAAAAPAITPSMSGGCSSGHLAYGGLAQW